MNKIIFSVIFILCCTSVLYAQNNPGEVRVTPSIINVVKNQDFTLLLHLATPDDALSAFSIEIRFDPLYMDINPETGIIPEESDLPYFTHSPKTGIIHISGTSPGGISPAPDIPLFSLDISAKEIADITPIVVVVKELVNSYYEDIGKPHEICSRVKITEYLLGDYNNDNAIDIIDALLIAQLYVGIIPPSWSYDVDVDCNGTVDIIDALLIAQFYVGLISEFCTGNIIPTLTPTEPPPEQVTEPGDMWVSPSCLDTTYNKEFELGLRLNTGTNRVYSYQCEIAYDSSFLTYDDVHVGEDGFLTAVYDLIPGVIKINGFDVFGEGRGTNLDFLKITFKANERSGSSYIYCTVTDLYTHDGTPIGTPRGIRGLVRISPYMKGDINEDEKVTVKDAMMAYEYSFSFPGSPPLNYDAWDTNCDGEISIMDYIKIMEYIVGKTDEFCGGNNFPAPVPTDSPTRPGDVWISPTDQNVVRNNALSYEIHVNSGNQKLSSYDLQLEYDSSYVEIDILAGQNGISAGEDGFIDEVIPETGIVRIKGTDIQGTGPGNDLGLLTVFLKSKEVTGLADLHLTINLLEDPSMQTIGTPRGIPGAVKIHDNILGDTNNDTLINIYDAFFIQVYDCGWSLCPVWENSDINFDGVIDIVDSLIIALYCVGNTEHFPAVQQ